MNECGMVQEIHQKVLHAAQGPGALIEREPNSEKTEAIPVLRDSLLNISEKARIQWIGEMVILETWFGKDVFCHIPDILIHAPVPGNTKNILDAVMTKVGKKTNITTQPKQVVLENIIQVLPAVMRTQLFFRLHGETKRPGYVGWYP